MKIKLAKFSLFMILIFLAGCGVKGDPMITAGKSGILVLVKNMTPEYSYNPLLLELDLYDKDFANYIDRERSKKTPGAMSPVRIVRLNLEEYPLI